MSSEVEQDRAAAGLSGAAAESKECQSDGLAASMAVDGEEVTEESVLDGSSLQKGLVLGSRSKAAPPAKPTAPLPPQHTLPTKEKSSNKKPQQKVKVERPWSSSQDKKGRDQVVRLVRKPTTELPEMIRLWQAGPTHTNQGGWLQPPQCLGAWNGGLRPLFSPPTYQEVMDVMVHTKDGAVAII